MFRFGDVILAQDVVLSVLFAVDKLFPYLLQVHGGTSKNDIKNRVNKAIQIAKENEKKVPGIYTIVFFDEANTTEAVEMIKEILCDHTMTGKPLGGPGGLKFIAACNPYRK